MTEKSETSNDTPAPESNTPANTSPEAPASETTNDSPAPVADLASAESPSADSSTADNSVAEGSVAENSDAAQATGNRTAGGPISLDRIRELRKSQQASPAKPRVAPLPAASVEATPVDGQGKRPRRNDRNRPKREKDEGPAASIPERVAPKISVPSRRQPLSDDLELELQAALGQSDLDKILVGESMVQVGRLLEEGQRIQGKVVKADDEFVFLSLGGPNEGVIPMLQFEEKPEAGSQIEVVVRGFLQDEGLYELTMPGNAVDVSDWSDIQEGEVVEALVTGSNTGGLECKVGSIPGFIPASQAAEYRVENLADFVDQKVLCVVTEANERRGNLVLSRRAVLEREKQEKRAERLAALSIGDAVDGTVRKITDFGAFVDIGGLDGLLHISQLSWERVEHPSEVLEEGQQIKVRIDKMDEQSGKIGLSLRSLQEHPWTDIETQFPVGALVRGSVTRIAEFGAFVRVSTGVEGLIHVSELAHHRVFKVTNVVQEGQEVEVKVLSVDTEQQRMSLSLKAAQAAPVVEEKPEDSQEEEPRPEPVLPKHRGPLKGGTGGNSGGDQFGLKW